jgi:uncharacterized protein
MTFRESVLLIDGRPTRLPGVVCVPEGEAAAVGVIIVVGGPQYRVGSHRQFVLTARQLAAEGWTTLRFDVQGMGDAPGEPAGFEALDGDIGAAIGALLQAQPRLQRVVLYGLCDGASAILLYCAGRDDPRVAGLCLLNPWLRSPETQARTQVRHYYLQRLGSAAFWKKLLSGQVAARALRELLGTLQAAAAPAGAAAGDFRQRMAAGWQRFAGRSLLVLSGADLTAREFEAGASQSAAWQGVLGRPGITRVDFTEADHTFSEHGPLQAMTARVGQWLRAEFGD